MKTSTKVFSVSEINQSIKKIITDRNDLKDIWVKGEISNYSVSGAGHCYFSLKDSNSVLKCTFFSFQFRNYKGKPLKEGVEVQVYGSLSVYESGGTYNLNINRVEEVGKGDLLYQIEQLKIKLKDQGIFDPAHKKPIPKYPKTLGIATALNGAAIADIIRIAKDRFPDINILIAPCIVQGEMAVSSISNAIKELNNPIWKVDVIIAGRGGGSSEDLMAFNDENLVMAYYNSKLPIISAVGHQTDSVLTDFAADAYTPTPTAAAELAVPKLEEYTDYLDNVFNRISNSLNFVLNNYKERFNSISSRNVFQNPLNIIEQRILKVDEVVSRLILLGRNNHSKKINHIQKFDKLKLLADSLYEKKKNKYSLISERIDNFSPLGTLKRGYSITRSKNKNIIKKIEQIEIGESVEIILFKGKIIAEVKEKYE
jgi:exodeoxyribonuclease VII large subunit